jgi:hypothetical protein
MVSIIFVLSLLLLGPLALLFGADSRDRNERDERGWWPGSPRSVVSHGGRTAPASENALAGTVRIGRASRSPLALVRSQPEPRRGGECAASN